MCHVIQVKPNALRLSDVLQEQIIVSGVVIVLYVSVACIFSKLRYQKAVEAKKIVEKHETDQGKL